MALTCVASSSESESVMVALLALRFVGTRSAVSFLVDRSVSLSSVDSLDFVSTLLGLLVNLLYVLTSRRWRKVGSIASTSSKAM